MVPDGTQIASPVNNGTIQIWDPINGVNALHFPAFPAPPTVYPEGIAWSSDRKRLALGTSDGLIRIWDAKAGNLLQTCRGHKGTFWWVEWSSDGSRLVSAGQDATVRIWDIATGETVLTYTGHSRAVMDVEWSANNKWIASTSEDATVHIWDANSGQTALVY